jgi:MFS family permease
VGAPVRPAAAVLLPVYLSTILAMFSYALVVVVLPFRFQVLGLSIVDYGIALSVFALGMLVTEGLWGAVAFRIGSPPRLLALGVVVAGLLVLLGLSDTFPEFVVTLGLYGALVVFPIPLARWLALTAGGPGTGGRGTGRYVLAFGIGLSAGSALGPTIYSTWGFFATVLVALAVFAVSVVQIAFLPWRSVDLPVRAPHSPGGLSTILTRHFAVCASLVSLAFIAYTLPTSFLQYYSVSIFHGTNAESGYVIGAYRATQMIAGFLLGTVVDRRGPARSAPFGFLLVAIGAVATGFAASYWEMSAATLVFAIGTGWLSAALLPLVLEPVPRPLQGTAVGAFGSFEDLGLLIGPVVLSGAYSTAGESSIFFVVAALAIGGMALAILARSTGVFRGGAT